jgi:hypothetical protein
VKRRERRRAGHATVRDGRYQAKGLGTVARAQPVAQLPVKEPGRHRWVATGAYTLTPSQAAAADAGSQVTLDPTMLVAFGVGCIDCEREYHGSRTDPCTVGDEWRT